MLNFAIIEDDSELLHSLSHMLESIFMQHDFDAQVSFQTTDENELKKLEDAIAFRNVANMPARVKCALLAWHTLEDLLNKNENGGKGTIDCCH